MKTTNAPVRLLILGAPHLIRAGLHTLLEPHSQCVVPVADTSQEPVADVVLLDLGHEGSVLAKMHAAKKFRLPIVVLSPDGDDRSAADAMRAGATGSVGYSVDAQELLDAVTRTAVGVPQAMTVTAGSAGEHVARIAGLSRRESQVVDLIARGRSNLEISQQLFLSPNTIKTYVRTAYQKIGVQKRPQAVAWAIRHGHVPMTGHSDLDEVG